MLVISGHNSESVTEIIIIIIIISSCLTSTRYCLLSSCFESPCRATLHRHAVRRAWRGAACSRRVPPHTHIASHQASLAVRRSVAHCAIVTSCSSSSSSSSLVDRASVSPRCHRRRAAVTMSSLSETTMTDTQQPTATNSTIDSAMIEKHSSPTDSSAFKAIFIPLYGIVFCLCFAGQLLYMYILCIAITSTSSKSSSLKTVSS